MITINNNNDLSFKANIVTKLRGRDNVMGKIVHSFAEQTKGTNGELLIKRGKGEYKGSLVCTLKGVKDSPDYYIGDYGKYLGQEAKDVHPTMIDNLATRLYKVMLILKKEHDFNTNNTRLDKEINRINKVLKSNLMKLEALKSSKKDSVFIGIYETLVESMQGRIKTLAKEKQDLKAKLVHDSQQIAGTKDEILNEYVGILDDIL